MIIFKEVSKQYDTLTALSDISFEVEPAEFVFLIGPSGAGKSTLLKLVIREDIPTSGQVFVDGTEISNLPQSSVPQLRRRVGTIFQDFKLLPQRTVFENVSFPLEIIGLPDEEIEKVTNEMLGLIGLEHKARHFPMQLSGGEAQRTVIARAMILRPEILLADEPTGNLDPGSAWEVMQLLARLNSLGTTVLMATHNVDISSSLPHRMLELQSGRIVKDSKQGTKKPKEGDRPKKK